MKIGTGTTPKYVYSCTITESVDSVWLMGRTCHEIMCSTNWSPVYGLRIVIRLSVFTATILLFWSWQIPWASAFQTWPNWPSPIHRDQGIESKHTHAHTHTHTHMLTHVQTYTQTYTHTRTHAHTHTRTHAHTHTSTHNMNNTLGWAAFVRHASQITV